MKVIPFGQTVSRKMITEHISSLHSAGERRVMNSLHVSLVLEAVNLGKPCSVLQASLDHEATSKAGWGNSLCEHHYMPAIICTLRLRCCALRKKSPYFPCHPWQLLRACFSVKGEFLWVRGQSLVLPA